MAKFWAKRGRKTEGPFADRQEAIREFSNRHPVKGADYLKRAKVNQIMVGYGEYGPSFDLQWHNEDKG